MVQKGKKKQRKCNKINSRSILIRSGKLVYKLSIRSEIRFEERIILDLKDEIENIYNYYLRELSRRLMLINFEICYYEPKDYVYAIDPNRAASLRSHVKKILKCNCIKLVYNIFYITIHNFLTGIKEEINLYQDRSEEFKIICLAEALNALESSAKELGKVTNKLPEHCEIESNCEKITKLAFYDKILKYYEEIINENCKLSKCIIIQNMITLVDELKSYNKSDSGSSSESSSDISQKSIEEIMCFIDGKNLQQIKVIRQNKQIICLDQEIEKFKTLLESSEEYDVKLKPNFSLDWISSLKLRLKNNRTS